MLSSPSIQSALLPPTAPASPEISASGADLASGFDALLAAIVPTSPAIQPAAPVAALPSIGNPLPVSVAAVLATPEFSAEPPRSALPALPITAAQPQPQPQPQTQPGAVLPRALAGTALSRIASTLPGELAYPVATLAISDHGEAPVVMEMATSLINAAPILAALNPDTVPIQPTVPPAELVPTADTTPQPAAVAAIERPVPAQPQALAPNVAVVMTTTPKSRPGLEAASATATAITPTSGPAPAPMAASATTATATTPTSTSVFVAPTAAVDSVAAPIAQVTQHTGIKPDAPGLRRSPQPNPAKPDSVQPVAKRPTPAQPAALTALARSAIKLPPNGNPVGSAPVSPLLAAPVNAATVRAASIPIVPVQIVPVQIVPVQAAPAQIVPVSATPVSPTPVRAKPVQTGQSNAALITQAPGLIRAAARANPAAGLASAPLAPVSPVLPAEFDPAAVIASAAPPIAKRNPGLNPAHQPATVATDLRIDASPRTLAPAAQTTFDPAKLRLVPVSDAITPLAALSAEPTPAISAYIGPARGAAESAQPLDFAALIGRIETAREAGGNAPITFSLRHEEFGPVGLRIGTDAGQISVDLSSPDPDFARAVAAAQPAASDAPRNDNGKADSGRSDNQRGDTSARGQESSTGNSREGGGTGRGASDERGNRQPEARRSATGAKSSPDQTDLYA